MLNWRQTGIVWRQWFPFVGVVPLLLVACSGPAARGTLPSTTAPLSWPTGKTLAAIGVRPQEYKGSKTEDAAWRDRRLAFGLTNLLAESFYETGKFRLLEEKDLRQRQLIEALVELFWSAARPQPADVELASIAPRLDADLLAYATVGYSRSSGQRLQLGPVGSYQQRLRVNVEVCLYERITGQTRCRDGEGTAQQEGLAVVYEFRNDRLDFETSATGRATKAAVTAAVEALVAGIRFSP